MKKSIYLLGVMMTGFLISACVQEPRPPQVAEPVQYYSPAAEPHPTVAEESHGMSTTSYPVAHPVSQARYNSRQINHQVDQAKPVRAVKLSPNFPMSQNIAIYGFNQIVISGDVSGTVNGGQPQDQLQVNGTVESLKHFSARTKRGVLYIDSSEPVNISLNLATPIRDLLVESSGNMQIKGIANQSTKVGISGNGVTSLRGELVLSRVNISGDATLHAYWINSSNLHVVAQDHSKLFLAGVATNLDIIATDDAEVDAKNLHADNVYVRTTDDADVGVTVNRSLSTLSTQHSTVYYYQDSKVGQHYLDYHGSALRMKGIPNPPQFYTQ